MSKKVVLIDLDPSAGATIAVTGKMGYERTALDLVRGAAKLEDVIVEVGNLLLMPAHPMMKDTAEEGFKLGARLKTMLEPLAEHTWVVDFPPQLDKWFIAGLRIIKNIIVPIDMQILSLRGLNNLIEAVSYVQEINEGLNITEVVCNRYYKRKKLTKIVEEEIAGVFESYSIVRDSVKIPESQVHNQSVYEYAPDSAGAIDLMNLVEKVSSYKSPQKIGVVNHKGGVGKTTISTNLAWGLAMKGSSNGKQ